MKNAPSKTEKSALSLTRSPHDLSGRWLAEIRMEDEMATATVQLAQFGVSVFGEIQLKFATQHPLFLSAILVDSRLLGTYYRPSGDGIGSGILDLNIVGEGKFSGASTWFGVNESESGNSTHHWTRVS